MTIECKKRHSGLVRKELALEATEDGKEVTPAMERAGITRLADLLEAGTSLAYVASEVFQAMEGGTAALHSGR